MAGERRVTAMAIALAAFFVALTAITFVFPDPRLGAWLPIHLLLAGAATTAIAGVMPFFSAAVTRGRPAHVVLRTLAVVGVATGAFAVAAGRVASPAMVGPAAMPTGIGGLVFVVGVVGVAAATLLPLRSASGPARLILGAIYSVALLNVLIGALLASLLLLGADSVSQAWLALKPAHAWLNLFGFVSLVVAGSLLHLLPTVAGARINRTRASVATFALLPAGPPLAAVGFALESRITAVAGALLVVGGAIALAIHAATVMARRANWTTDATWHRFTSVSLLAAISWFLVGTTVAASTTLTASSLPSGWQIAPLIAPLGLGWVAQVLIGAWSHLVPAVGAGSPERHARQRQILGTAATVRLIIYNGGVVAMLIATVMGETAGALFVGGMLAAALVAVSSVGLLAIALISRDPAGRLTA
jgi:nitrite reductase (NO-forming)